MNVKSKNALSLYLFSVCIGGTVGAVIWLFLKAMALGTEFLWVYIPDKWDIPLYSLLICAIGGCIIGLFRKKYGDYPEELPVVLGAIKKEHFYEYRNMPVLIISALLPLIFGSSVGPEAGMTGIIAALCYWAGENLKFAKRESGTYSEIGVAVTLGVLFHSPLFGIFSVEESADNAEAPRNMSNASKFIIYGLAASAGVGIYTVLSNLFGAGMTGFPSFSAVKVSSQDYVMILLYILAGLILAVFYQITHHGTKMIADKLPPVLREVTGGLILGVIGLFVPAMMFSGEEQMGALMTEYTNFLPLALILGAFLKILLTNLCIQLGLKGGHFFPVIFGGVCMGYGIAMIAFPSGGHEAFAAAIVTASLLGGIMKKPLAVTCLLFICFPIRIFVWILLASSVGAALFSSLHKS